MPKLVHVPSIIGIDFLGFNYLRGSDFEFKGRLGTSHLMEHLMSKSFDDLLPKLQRLGVEHNAGTGFKRILFWFFGLEESLKEVSQELYDRVTSGKHTWTKEQFDNEKSTVLEEYGDTFNDQACGTLHNFMRRHYDCFGPIGLRQDIENFTYEQSLEARSQFTIPSTVCYVGRTPELSIQEGSPPEVYLSRPIFGRYDNPEEPVPREGKVIIGLLSRSTIPRDKTNRVRLVLDCLGSGLESPLSQEIREKRGLAYYDLAYLHPVYGEHAICFFAPTSKKNRQALTGVYQEFFSGDLSRHISQDRFDDIYSSVMISKKMGERLPHEGAQVTVLQDSPYEGLEGFTYQNALELLREHFQADLFERVEY